MIAQTSLNAYEEAKTNLATKQDIIYNTLIALGQANNLMIAKRLGWAINSVTPRVNELVKEGKIVQVMTYPCPYTGRLTKYWKVRVNGGIKNG